jgi:hypothetical protein
MAEELILEDEHSRVDPQVLLRQYAELVRKQSAVRVEPVRLPNLRRPLYGVAVLLAAAVYVGTVCFLLQPGVIAGVRPPAAVLAIEHQDVCAQRQAEILRAVAAYRRDHGVPPDRLERLTPHYLPAPATDPALALPYEYDRQGAAVILTCPNPGLHF